MIVTEKDLEHDFMICSICGKFIEVGQSYEKIVTQRKSEITVHTDCIGK
jgi:Fe2+ or Zn2+ uptake regulation protein